MGLALMGLGAFSVWSMAPVHFVPALLVGFVGFVWALDRSARQPRPRLSGFFRGWCFGVGYFFSSVWWTVNAFLVDGWEYAWLVWLPLIIFPAGLALFWGLAGAVYTRLNIKGPQRVIVFSVLWISVEFARAHVLSGFPWNLAGHAWPAGGVMSQSAAWIGASGLSALTLFACVAWAALKGREAWALRVLPGLIGLAMLIVVAGLGLIRLQGAQDLATTDTRLRLVHLNFAQRDKTYENATNLVERYLDQSLQPGFDQVDAIIWPEGAIPAFILRDRRVRESFEARLPNNSRFIIGTPRADTINERIRYYNSLIQLAYVEGELRLEGVYDKVKLVPFGESNPLITVTELLGFTTLSETTPVYSAGLRSMVLTTTGLPAFSPLICYEAVFPRFIPRGTQRPKWLLNISNDAWYGSSAGPHQLMNMTRYRSIEEGIALVRSASAGTNGQIDPYGRMNDLAAVSHDGYLDLMLLEPLDETFFAVYGDWPWLLGLGALFVGMFGVCRVLRPFPHFQPTRECVPT